MLYVFVPYYNPPTNEFLESLAKQTNVSYRLITRDRKSDAIYWTRAVNDFYKEIQRYLGTSDTDVVCIMNNDIEFDSNFFEQGSKCKPGEVLVALNTEVSINWKNKQFGTRGIINSFYGRAFFMTLGDFKRSGGFCRLLPHALADIEFGYRVIKKGLKPRYMIPIKHNDHHYEKVGKFSLLSYENPILWTIFLLKCFNRYTLKNIAKAWIQLCK